MSDYINGIFFDIEDDENHSIKTVFSDCSLMIGVLNGKLIEIFNELTISEIVVNEKADHVVLAFIRKIIEQLDSIAVLISKSCISQAYNILRSLYETSLQLVFILSSDSVLRASCYHIDYLLQEIELSKKLQGKMFDHQSFDSTKQIAAIMSLIELNQHLKEAYNLRTERLEELNKKRKRKTNRIKWYQICSKASNLSMLSDLVDRTQYHNDLYSSLSQETHGLGVMRGTVLALDGVILKPIRLPSNARALFELVCSISTWVLRNLYIYVGMDEAATEDAASFFPDFLKKRDSILISLG